jgi:ribosomal protein S18 acetylase RimI-like enzyme
VSNITIQQAHKADFELIAKLIAFQNKTPETHCIQSDTGDNEQNIYSEIARLDLSSEICFVMAFQDDQLTGVFGCELDEELGRGWLRGPFVVENMENWNATASALLQGLLDILPASIHRLDSFLNIANKRGNDFYLNHNFQQLRLVHVYVTAPPGNPFVYTNTCQVLKPYHAQDFIDLHQAVFPNTYATGQRILDKLGDHHQVFVYPRESEILGYVYVAIEEDSEDGSIEFIGVREDARGQGIGRQLLQTALQWLFEEKKVPQTNLVVNDNLANARSLYESVGFRLKYTGVHARKDQ